jgi:glutaredoxin
MQSVKILKFYSPSCMPCKLLTNVLKEEQIEHESIDITVDINSILVTKYNIRTVPVLIRVDSMGNEKGRLLGFPGTTKVKSFCDEI